MTFEQEVTLIESPLQQEGESGDCSVAEVLCRGRINVACLDAQTMRPKAIPVPVREEMFCDN